jgi:O-antigen/teichoic acid export membrane protein
MEQPVSDPNEVKRKAVRGGFSLLIRQGLGHLIVVFGNIVLARLLVPEDFGIYAVVMLVATFLTLFGDVGLGASLIQRKEEPSLEDWRTVFTFQQILVVTFVLIIFFAAPLIRDYYEWSSSTPWFIRVTALSLMITSFRTIPAARLERDVEFKRLALVELIEILLFQGTAVLSALLGFGAWSFVLGLLARSIGGTGLIYWMAPWPIGWKWDWTRTRSLMRFGLPYQGVGVVSFVKDSINPVLIGKLLGPAAVGYVNWAGTVSVYPVIALGSFVRLFFPTFSRLQSDPPALAAALERVLRWNNLIAFGLFALLLSQAEEITVLVFGEKWLPGLNLLYLLSFANFFVASGWPLMALLNAVGKSHINFTFAMIWMVCTWAFGVPLIDRYGILGFGMANVLVQLSNVGLFWYARRLIPFRWLTLVGPNLIALALAIVTTLGVKQLMPGPSMMTLIVLAGITLFVYLSSVFAFSRGLLIQEIQSMVRIVRYG